MYIEIGRAPFVDAIHLITDSVIAPLKLADVDSGNGKIPNL